jgi:Site-specific recombinase XerD
MDMGSRHYVSGVFQKVAECLYRYSSNGVYYARVKVCGKEIRRSLETTDRALAKRRLSFLKDEQSLIDRSKSKLTLAELCDQYLKTVQHQKAKTVERKVHIVRRIKRDWPRGSNVQVSKIKPSDVQLWLACYKFGPVSRNQHLAGLKQILKMAVADGVITRSPAENIALVKLDKPIRETPTFDEFKAIVADIRNQRFSNDARESADFVEFLGLAGLGQAEATSLRWSDIDWERETIRTFRHKTNAGFVIPLYPQVKPLLERRKSEINSPGDLVFFIKSAKKAVASACRRLGLPNYTHRSFRRMFITRAIEKGIDVKVISEWQGHKDGGKLILDTYSHVNPVHSQRMARLMATDEAENVVHLNSYAP